jgi:SSS family solute:Na+ symporter
LLAAVMSTVESALNSTATVTAEDIVKRMRPQTKDRTLVLIGRITAGVVIVLAMIWSPFCGRFNSIFEVINKVPMMFAPAITTVFVLGVFWSRGTGQAATATFVTGLAAGLTYFIIDLPRSAIVNGVRVENYQTVAHGFGIPFMMMGLVLLIVCVTVYVIVSLMTPRPVKELEAIHWEPPLQAIVSAQFAGLTDPRLVAVSLAALMAVLYVIFR